MNMDSSGKVSLQCLQEEKLLSNKSLHCPERKRHQGGETSGLAVDLFLCFSALGFASALSYIYPVFSYKRGCFFFCNIEKAGKKGRDIYRNIFGTSF